MLSSGSESKGNSEIVGSICGKVWASYGVWFSGMGSDPAKSIYKTWVEVWASDGVWASSMGSNAI